MSSISMLSEITRGALDPEGWQPLIDARPDWFEVIHLYGTKSGWERLKQLSLTRIPLHDTSTLLTGSPPPLATSMSTGLPAAPRRRDRDGQSTRRLGRRLDELRTQLHRCLSSRRHLCRAASSSRFSAVRRLPGHNFLAAVSAGKRLSWSCSRRTRRTEFDAVD
jgi:hypothetical protein